jgi:hypothetical protein
MRWTMLELEPLQILAGAELILDRIPKALHDSPSFLNVPFVG